MRAVILTIGSEITGGRIVDTNASWMARELEHRGVRTVGILSAPDSVAEIGRALHCALDGSADLIVMAGGLGPTADDLTAEAISLELGMPLELNSSAAAMVAAATGAKNSGELHPHQQKQARLPAGVEVLPPAGTAPGFTFDHGGARIVVLPGVPHEMARMWESARQTPGVFRLLGAELRGCLTLRLYGIGEPQVDAAVEGVTAELLPGERASDSIEIGICARYREIDVDITYSRGHEELAARMHSELRERLAGYVFSEGETIAEVVGRELGGRGLTLATGESCTGGLLGAEITSVSGSSQYFLGGIIAYHNDVKRRLLAVDQGSLDSSGAVSETVALQLAAGARQAIKADFGIGITGVAGPTGGTADKPVGLVYVGVSSAAGGTVQAFNFPGGRDDVRRASVIASLHLLLKMVLSDI